MPKPPATWKHVELWYARDLGVERYSKQGLGEATPDVVSSGVSFEIKHGKQIPKRIVEYVSQAEDNCLAKTVPIVIMHPERCRYKDALVVMRYSTFKQLTGIGDQCGPDRAIDAGAGEGSEGL